MYGAATDALNAPRKGSIIVKAGATGALGAASAALSGYNTAT